MGLDISDNIFGFVDELSKPFFGVVLKRTLRVETSERFWKIFF